jgi:2-oxoglutarate ferredoxin oxidoreductase subunit delta
MGQVTIDKESCKGCGLCVAFCAKQVLAISSGLNQAGHHPVEVVVGDAEAGCTACSRCALMCPDAAITVYR